MKTIFICGRNYFIQSIVDAIAAAAASLGQAAPEIVTESNDCQLLIPKIKACDFPIVIMDKHVPGRRDYENSFSYAREIRVARNEPTSNYGISEKDALIIIFSEQWYSWEERGALYQFFSPNLYLKKDRDATEADIAAVAIGAQVFGGAWMFPHIVRKLDQTFSSLCR